MTVKSRKPSKPKHRFNRKLWMREYMKFYMRELRSAKRSGMSLEEYRAGLAV